MKRYLVLFGVAVILAMVVLAAGRNVDFAPGREETLASPPPFELDLTITAQGHLVPSLASVPKDHVVRLEVANRFRKPVSLKLLGYEDRGVALTVASDSVWRGEFIVDRPGEDFAWMLDGVPSGQLRVTGSHLVEGHR